MRTYQERAVAARQLAQIRQLQLQQAQADESSARRAAERSRIAHEQAVAEEQQCRAGHVRALDAQRMVDVTVLRQWMHLAAAAERKLASVAIEYELAQAQLRHASTAVSAGARRVEDANHALRQATRRLQRKQEEKQLESLESLLGARAP